VAADRRLAIMANGPATVVSIVHASPGDKASAYDWTEAEAHVRGLCQQAERGQRGQLLDMFKLIRDDASHARDRPTVFLAEPVLQAVRAGRLLIIPGWPQGPAQTLTPYDRRSAHDDHQLIKHIMGEDEHLSLERQKYRLIHADQWEELRKIDTHLVVPKEHAIRILKRLAGRIASPTRRAALHQAAGKLAHRHKPGSPNALMVLRELAKPSGSAASTLKATGHATTPSTTKPAATGPAPGKTRKVLNIAWSQAETWCSEDAAYAVTTEGYAAGDALDVTVQGLGGGAHKEALKLSSSTFSGKWSAFIRAGPPSPASTAAPGPRPSPRGASTPPTKPRRSRPGPTTSSTPGPGSSI
jgi:hypothetical protein